MRTKLDSALSSKGSPIYELSFTIKYLNWPQSLDNAQDVMKTKLEVL